MNRGFNSAAFSLILLIPAASGWPTDGPSKANPPIEQQPGDAKSVKVVLIAGSNFYKPGEHEYVAACSLLMDLLRQTPGVEPVLALDWPKKPETMRGARAIVFFFDGGDKHGILMGNRVAEVQKLADEGVGFVQLHQAVDYPKDLGEKARTWTGAAWEKGYSDRAHWVAEFNTFPNHPIFRGVKPFKIDDGWLTNLRFAEGMKGVTPLLRTVSPKAEKKPVGSEDVIGWAFERPGGGRSFSFTGGHLHNSFAQEGYRRFLVNGILWAANVEIPNNGAVVDLDPDSLPNYLKKTAKQP